jgi:hypothetical protein
MPQQGRGGMGSHKHGTSGHASRTPGYKMQRTREANKLAEEDAAKRPKPKMFQSISDAMKKR